MALQATLLIMWKVTQAFEHATTSPPALSTMSLDGLASRILYYGTVLVTLVIVWRSRRPDNAPPDRASQGLIGILLLCHSSLALLWWGSTRAVLRHQDLKRAMAEGFSVAAPAPGVIFWLNGVGLHIAEAVMWTTGSILLAAALIRQTTPRQASR